ncbi:hypothetical protein [Streptomyces goshikiensis]|uniref:hypothetical protein n=1 Tax=Streptomyces goshikiensis TaxID=1942 RepID=UPI0036B62B51
MPTIPTPHDHALPVGPLAASAREIRHEVRIDLTDAPTLTNLIGRTQKPHGLRLAYVLREDIARVDVIVEWEDSAERWPPVAEMPGWLRDVIGAYRPRDVDGAPDARPAGLGGWPLEPSPGSGDPHTP